MTRPPNEHAEKWRRALVATLVFWSLGASASAQNYSFDARRIALGGAGGTPNVASKLVEEGRRYKSILIPGGLVKMLTDLHVFYPNRERKLLKQQGLRTLGNLAPVTD